MRNVQVNAVIPTDQSGTDKRRKYKTLYLLHGIFGNQYDWLNGTMLERWAMERNIAVILPAGDNRFYLD